MTDWKPEIREWLKDLNLSAARENEIVEELAVHLEDRRQDLLVEGATEADASRIARTELLRDNLLLNDLRQVESPRRTEPVVLGANRPGLTAGIWHDLRYAIRMLVKQRGVTFVAVCTMALGIGVNTTVFSTLELLVYRPFAFANQERLLAIFQQEPEAGIRHGLASPADFVEWRERSRRFERLVASATDSFDLLTGDQPERIAGSRVSEGFFAALGAKAVIGQTFDPTGNSNVDQQVVVLKHSLWQSRFGADPSIVGRTILLNRQQFTVVGVMPAAFDYPVGGGELWTPLIFSPQEKTDHVRHYLRVVGLPRSGVSIGQATAELGEIFQSSEQRYPEATHGRSIRVVSLIQDATRGARVGAPFMFISVILVLLLACANVANLLLVRATLRNREIAIRLALGASRFRVMRQLLADGLLLACLGGVLGLLLAMWGISAVRGVPRDFSKLIPGWENIGIDQSALVFTVVISVVTGLLCGLLPALTGTRINLNKALKEGGRGFTGPASNLTPHNLLVVAEVAISLVLLAGAGTMLKSFSNLLHADLGVKPSNVLTLQVSLSGET